MHETAHDKTTVKSGGVNERMFAFVYLTIGPRSTLLFRIGENMGDDELLLCNFVAFAKIDFASSALTGVIGEPMCVSLPRDLRTGVDKDNVV
jgi:hypothetical protein